VPGKLCKRVARNPSLWSHQNCWRTTKMKTLAINNGKERTAYTFIEGTKETGYSVCSDFLTGNITVGIKGLCNRLHPEEIILQLPPTGLDKRTQKAIQQGFGRNIAAAFSLKRHPVIRNLMRARATYGCCRREDARKLFGRRLKRNQLRNLNRRQQIQLINTLTLAWDSVSAAESAMS
jgi:hypothetical protein